MYEIWGAVYPPPANRGPDTTFFRRLRNLAATLTAYIFRMPRDIHNRTRALGRPRGLVRRLKIWTLFHKRLKIGPAFLPTLRKFCILLYCQAYFR